MDQTETKPIFGIHPIKEALESGKSVDRVFILERSKNEGLKEIAALARMMEIPVKYVPEPKLNRITGKNHQGCIAFLAPIDFQPLDEVIQQVFERGETPLLIVFDGITDVRNLGAISRSALSAGAHALILPFKSSAPVNADAVKTSAGALMQIPVCKPKHMNETKELLKNYGIKLIACTEKADETIYKAPLNEPVAIVLGDEEKGISTQMLNSCEMQVKIPMPGDFDSLNVSTAAGIILFEAVKQRFYS